MKRKPPPGDDGWRFRHKTFDSEAAMRAYRDWWTARRERLTAMLAAWQEGDTDAPPHT